MKKELQMLTDGFLCDSSHLPAEVTEARGEVTCPRSHHQQLESRFALGTCRDGVLNPVQGCKPGRQKQLTLKRYSALQEGHRVHPGALRSLENRALVPSGPEDTFENKFLCSSVKPWAGEGGLPQSGLCLPAVLIPATVTG